MKMAALVLIFAFFAFSDASSRPLEVLQLIMVAATSVIILRRMDR